MHAWSSTTRRHSLLVKTVWESFVQGLAAEICTEKWTADCPLRMHQAGPRQSKEEKGKARN